MAHEIVDMLDSFGNKLDDLYVEAIFSGLLLSSVEINRYDSRILYYARVRTSAFIEHCSRDLNTMWSVICEEIDLEKKVPASDQLGGQTDAETMRSCSAPKRNSPITYPVYHRFLENSND